MPGYIDISVPISPATPVWPGSPPVELARRLDLDRGDPVNDTTLRCSVHTGTHIDAPLHHLRSGLSVDRVDIDALVGPARVIVVEDVSAVSAESLERAGVPASTSRLLIRTDNSWWWSGSGGFRRDYVGLTADGAQWVVDRNIQLIGIDYLSIQRYTDGAQTHLILLSAGVVVLEGLNLLDVAPGPYELLCLPLCLVGAEGAPARAVLRKP